MPACSLWLKPSGWTGERSLKSSGRLYIRIMAAAAAPAVLQIRVIISQDRFILFTSSLDGYLERLDNILVKLL